MISGALGDIWELVKKGMAICISLWPNPLKYSSLEFCCGLLNWFRMWVMLCAARIVCCVNLGKWHNCSVHQLCISLSGCKAEVWNLQEKVAVLRLSKSEIVCQHKGRLKHHFKHLFEEIQSHVNNIMIKTLKYVCYSQWESCVAPFLSMSKWIMSWRGAKILILSVSFLICISLILFLLITLMSCFIFRLCQNSISLALESTNFWLNYS